MHMTTLAMLAGGVLGVLLRNLAEGPQPAEPRARWRPATIGVIGALILGGLTGATLIAAQGDVQVNGPAAVLSVGLSGLLLTYCLYSSAATELIKQGVSRQTVLPAITSAVSAFIAATAGVVLGITLAG